MPTSWAIAYQIIVTVLVASHLAITWHNLRYMPRLRHLGRNEASPEHDNPALLSILVPARNEERNITECVECLVRQDYALTEIIVLDDQSTDATSRLLGALQAKHRQLRVLDGQPLPSGWHGKAWACQQLAAQAKGEWLLFLDADSRPQPGLVSAAVSLSERESIGLLSLMPNMALERLDTWLVATVIPLVLIGAVPHGLPPALRDRFPAVALGSFLLFRRVVYDRIGGHGAVRRDIAEDFALARAARNVGERVTLADSREMMKVKFYANGREAWRGLAKSAFPALDYSLPGMLFAMLVATCTLVLPFVIVLGLLASGQLQLHFWVGLSQCLMACIALASLCASQKVPVWRGILVPFVVGAGLGVSLCSILRNYLGAGTVWKDRSYQFRKP